MARSLPGRDDGEEGDGDCRQLAVTDAWGVEMAELAHVLAPPLVIKVVVSLVRDSEGSQLAPPKSGKSSSRSDGGREPAWDAGGGGGWAMA